MPMPPPLVVAKRRLRWRLVAVFAAGLAALVAAAAWTYRDKAHDGAVAYETRPIGLGTVEKSISATGAVKALVTVDVGSQLSGLISEMKVDFNDPVKAGDLLAVIERAPFEAKTASAEANLAIARADVRQKEGAVAKARAQLVQATRDYARRAELAPMGHASLQQRDQSESLYGVAKAELAIAEAQIESAKATIAQREADLAKARIDLGYTLIRSPINGVVIDRKLQPGQTVAAEYQTPVLFQLAQDLSQILIYAQVDEADIGIVKRGAPATFSVEAFPHETFEGTVDQVRLAATKISGVVTYTVVIKAQNPDLRLFPDMTATVRIIGARRENVLAAPNDALRFRAPGAARGKDQPEGPVVWVLDSAGVLRGNPVRLGLKGDSSTEIVGGDIRAGDAIAVRGKRGSEPGRP
jgi:HlyD family secretion protein